MFIVFVFILTPAFGWAQNSNPDGLVGSPSLTLYYGYGSGNIKQTIGNSPQPQASLDNYGFKVELIYPASRYISFIFQANYEKQDQNFPENHEYLNMENKLTGYGFVFGIRLFSSGK